MKPGKLFIFIALICFMFFAVITFINLDKDVKVLKDTPEKTGESTNKSLSDFLALSDRLDSVIALNIKLIDQVKLEILAKCGEDLGPKSKIIVRKYSEKDPLRPTRMNLAFVEDKENFLIPMQTIGLMDNNTVSKNGKASFLIGSLKKCRKALLDALKPYGYKEDNLAQKLNFHIDEGSRNCSVLMCENYYDSSWMFTTFDHAPSVAALASLSSIQRDILSCRADVFLLIRDSGKKRIKDQDVKH